MSYHYVGSELELFATAINWKSYLASVLDPFVTGRVLDVGAGIGTNLAYMCNPRVVEWTSLEPDPELARQIGAAEPRRRLLTPCRVVTGTIGDLDPALCFDTILYLDVLEHIADDRAELARARDHLAPGGRLVVVAPAHPFLFSGFDAAIGHYRRYDDVSLRALSPEGCRLDAFLLLDCAGFFASLANRLILRKVLPSPRQIAVWDRSLVPASRRLDPLTGYKFGKTALAVWRAAA
ncbi:MAG TPA: class I SAM-dependent methyltransferase [Stellaceae bacterium]|nr:class I SAM-dependent methyltransferase [Stellaceae bacterium]